MQAAAKQSKAVLQATIVQLTIASMVWCNPCSVQHAVKQASVSSRCNTYHIEDGMLQHSH